MYTYFGITHPLFVHYYGWRPELHANMTLQILYIGGTIFVCCCVHIWSDDCLLTYVISVFVKFPVLVIIHYTCVQLDMQKALHTQCIIHVTYMCIHTYAHVYNVLHCTFIDLGGY